MTSRTAEPAEVMSNDLVTASPDESVLDAARRMEDAQVRHLPVLDAGLIAGIVSMRDLFAVLLDDGREPTEVVLRSANRGNARPDNRVTDKGFRVVCEIGP